MRFFEMIDSIIDNDQEKKIAYCKNWAIDKGITCNTCNNLAIPIFGDRHGYRCINCGRQFKHYYHFILYSREVYDQAVVRIKRELLENNK